jgi:organic radical activating enzyme
MDLNCDKDFIRENDLPDRGYLSEIFCSIQGEGLLVGERQIFVRCAGCSIGCRYCDTKYSNRRKKECIVFGSRRQVLANPVMVEVVLDEVARLAGSFAAMKTIVITGGEPLEQGRFITSLAQGLKDLDYNIYLDTNGIEVEGLARVIDAIDIFAMDMKLPPDVSRSYWPEHEAFLRRIVDCPSGDKTVFVKIVLGGNPSMDEFEKAVKIISEVNPDIPLVLQPESRLDQSAAGSGSSSSLIDNLADDLLKKQAFALKYLSSVRVIPQCHKILGVM